MAVVLAGVARLALLAVSDVHPRSLFFAAPDDAFYYLQIAWNLSRGLGSTFDGLHLTNGYQPAWCLLLVPVAWLSPTREFLLDASIWLACALHVASGLVLVCATRRLFAGAWTALVALLWFVSPRLDNLVHLEAPLNGLTLALVLWAGIDVARGGADTNSGGSHDVRGAARARLRLGLALALASLARLDNAVFVPAVLAAIGWSERGTAASRLRAVVRVGLPTAVALGTYAVVNRAYIGAWLPVSGTLKAEMLRSEIHNLLLGPGWIALPGFVLKQLGLAVTAGPAASLASWVVGASVISQRTSVLVIVVLVMATGAACRRAWTQAPGLRWLWVTGATATAGHFVFMLCMVGSFPREWHFVPEVMLLILAAGVGVPRMIDAFTERAGRAGPGIRAVCIGAFAAALGWRSWQAFQETQSTFVWGHLVANDQIVMSRYWGEQFPPGTRVGAWNAGYLAYFSDLQVVNLDGLVNEPSFVRQIADDRWLEYCQRNGIEYVIDTWGGAFDLLAKQTEIVARRHFSAGSAFEYVVLRIPPNVPGVS